jgi:Leucine-rich repeat (LRR) protein
MARRVLLAYERDLEQIEVDPADAPTLEVLDLNRNPRLRELRLGGNPITDLAADTFTRTPALRLLSLRGCALERLPGAVDGLGELRDLDLRANRLTNVPAWLGELPALARVDLRWNPLDAVPPALERLAADGGVLWHPAS